MGRNACSHKPELLCPSLNTCSEHIDTVMWVENSEGMLEAEGPGATNKRAAQRRPGKKRPRLSGKFKNAVMGQSCIDGSSGHRDWHVIKLHRTVRVHACT